MNLESHVQVVGMEKPCGMIGKGCFTSGNTCCDHYGWFHCQVPSTNDDIEVRWSKEFSSLPGEDIVTDQLEIWVM